MSQQNRLFQFLVYFINKILKYCIAIMKCGNFKNIFIVFLREFVIFFKFPYLQLYLRKKTKNIFLIFMKRGEIVNI